MPIRWTDEAKKKCSVRRGGVNAVVAPFDREKAIGVIREAIPIAKRAFAARGPLVALREKALASFDEEPKLEVDAQAALGVMFGLRGQVLRNPPLVDAILGAWVAIGGADFAVRALARIWTILPRDDSSFYTVDYDHVHGARPDAFFLEEVPFGDARWIEATDDPWAILHRSLVHLDDAAYARAREVTATLRKGVPPSPRWTTNLAFPCTRAWLADDLPALEADKKLRAALLSCIDEPDVAARWAKLSGKFGGYQNAFDLVDLLGDDAAPALAALMSVQGYNENRVFIAEAASIVESAAAAEAFVEWLALKPVAKLATAWLKAHPELARAALEGAIAKKSKHADVAAAILGALGSKNVDTKAAKSQEKTAAAKVVSKNVDVPLLADPPWRRERKKAAPKVVALKEIAYAPSIAWDAKEKEEALAYASRIAKHKNPNWSKSMYERHARAAGWGINLLAYMEDEALALAIWKEKNPKHWHIPRDDGGFEWMLAVHDVAALPAAIGVAQAFPETCFPLLMRARSAELVRAAAHVLHRLKKGKAEAFAYLVAHAGDATTTLLPAALGKPTKDREMAEAVLRALASEKHNEIMNAAHAYGGEAARALEALLAREVVTSDWPEVPPKLPSFADPAALPSVTTRTGYALDETSTRNLLELLVIAPIERRDLVRPVIDACDRRSLADFAWALFSAWIADGAPAKEGWAFAALGHLGDDETARKLAPMIRQWPGESLHARAVAGLDVLGAIGSDVALMHLNGIAEKLKFKALQARAREKIEEIAAARGLSAEALADRLVPDFGLDARGERVLDYGPRTFRVSFDEALTPIVIDEHGKKSAAPPKGAKSDDAEKAKRALEAFAALKKDAKTIARSVVLRLERAMCAGRRWNAGEFEALIARHPLVGHLARRLIFAVYDAKGEVTESFRVAEDGSFATVDDRPFAIDRDATIGVVHRLSLDDARVQRWGERFSEYEIVQPFDQLARATFAATKDERGSRSSDRVNGVATSPGKIRALVDGSSWRLGAPQDSGGIWWIEIDLGKAKARLDLRPGLAPNGAQERQTLGALTLSPKSATFGALTPIVASELFRDLEALRE